MGSAGVVGNGGPSIDGAPPAISWTQCRTIQVQDDRAHLPIHPANPGSLLHSESVLNITVPVRLGGTLKHTSYSIG